jgi:hypothetical protein
MILARWRGTIDPQCGAARYWRGRIELGRHRHGGAWKLVYHQGTIVEDP